MSSLQNFSSRLGDRLRLDLDDRRSSRRLAQIAREVTRHASASPEQRPVVFFRASTGLLRLSQNSAFPLLASWALGISGVPVIHFVCHAGMSRCVQGTHKDDITREPPCAACTAFSHQLYAGSTTVEFSYAENPGVLNALQRQDLDALIDFEYGGLPLGKLVLPSIRWILRRHHLENDKPTRLLFREYILSAYRVALEFGALLDQARPQAVVVFNGMFYPEATARWIARSRGVRSISHEVGFRPFSAFFTEGEATAYPIDIPESFQLSDGQNLRLDEYLTQRFQGNFTMAGIRFWPQMHGLDAEIEEHISRFKQVVPVFTNVVFDTSQVHANTVFPHMFAWLDSVLGLIRTHPETLFIIRAHPDEMRLNKESRESVRAWVEQNGVKDLSNALFIDSQERLSSYELIRRAKFVMIYNSSIGLEAALMGAPVLCAGKARFTQYPIVFFPPTPEGYREQAEAFLQADQVDAPPEYRLNARRFLYFHLYRASLPFEDFLENQERPGFVRLKEFSWEKLSPQQSPTLSTIVDGILNGRPFLLPESPDQPAAA